MPQFQDETLIEFTPLHQYKTKNCKARYFPLLKDLFEEFPDQIMNIEIKYTTMELVQMVARLIKQYNRQHITVNF